MIARETRIILLFILLSVFELKMDAYDLNKFLLFRAVADWPIGISLLSVPENGYFKRQTAVEQNQGRHFNKFSGRIRGCLPKILSVTLYLVAVADKWFWVQ